MTQAINHATPRIRGVVFDLDGTLVDTAADLATAVNLTRNHYALPALDEKEVVGYVGNGARLLIERALAGCEISVHEALPAFLHYYHMSQLEQVRPYPDVREVLERLRAAGLHLAVATNKPERSARAILAHLGLDGFFSHVLGDDGARPLKPAPDMLASILADWNLPAGECIHVGDSQVDVDFAHAAGLRVVFVAGGMGRLGTGGQPDFTVAGFAEIGAVFGLK